MEKKNFVSLIMGSVGGILFAIGMCMCLLEQWNAMSQGIVIAVIGMAVLLLMLLVRRRMEGKSMIVLNGKAIGTVILAIIGALLLGVGMCMVMIAGKIASGILVGVIGIALLICLIPICKGIN